MRAETSVPPALSAIAPARRWARARLTEAGVEHARMEILVLLVSELVTNAVEHADPPVVLRVDVDDERTHVEVVDGVRDEPVLRNPPPTALGGRGVMLVDRLASTWGTAPVEGDGKSVWFELRHDDLPTPHPSPAGPQPPSE